jgi:hypothetical protein
MFSDLSFNGNEERGWKKTLKYKAVLTEVQRD